MSYVYENAEDLTGQDGVGTKQCAALIKEYTKAPPSSLWRQGAAVKGNLTLRKGTAIATFVEGQYQNHASGNHAAFYIGQGADGIYVVDQWRGSKKVMQRTLSFLGKDKGGHFIRPSNNGDAFSVIE